MLDPRKPPELRAGLWRATILMTGPAGELGITTTGVAAVFDVGRDSSAGTGPTHWTSRQVGTGAIPIWLTLIGLIGDDEAVAGMVTHPMAPSVVHA